MAMLLVPAASQQLLPEPALSAGRMSRTQSLQ
jgi:hypothetical protein